MYCLEIFRMSSLSLSLMARILILFILVLVLLFCLSCAQRCHFVSAKTGQKISNGAPKNILAETEKYLNGGTKGYI